MNTSHHLEEDRLILFLMNCINFIKHIVSLSFPMILPQLRDIILQFCVMYDVGYPF